MKIADYFRASESTVTPEGKQQRAARKALKRARKALTRL